MTQMPPPPGMPYTPGQQINQPAQTNVAAIISLICGIIGCLGITALVSVICGIVGIVQAKTLKSGKGMAIAGIVLSILWTVVGIGGIVGSAYLGQWAITKGIGEASKPAITSILDDLADGNTTGAKVEAPGLTDDQAAALSAQLTKMGHVKSIDVKNTTHDFQGGKAKFSLGGTATFDNGAKDFDIDISMVDKQITVDRIEVK